MSKVQISVKKPFKLNVEGVHTDFPIGLQVVDQAVADHWYTQAHADVVGEIEEPGDAAEGDAATTDGETAVPAKTNVGQKANGGRRTAVPAKTNA